MGQESLRPGCHDVELFAADPRTLHLSRRRLDLDAEMHESGGDRLLARDRTDAPDARLSVCVGELTPAVVVFAGAPPGTGVLVSHAWWPLPEHLPYFWGSETVAAMAQALLARHLTALPAEPVQVAQGGTGLTSVPLAVEPGGCYLVLAAMTQSGARSVGLRVRVGGWTSSFDRGIEGEGALAAFCSEDRDLAIADVEARGTPLFGWGLAVYHLQSGVWEAPH
jgi:hypothetical protein